MEVEPVAASAHAATTSSTSVDPCGERGEFHTFVNAGPGFSCPVPVFAGEVVARDGFIFEDVVPDTAGGP